MNLSPKPLRPDALEQTACVWRQPSRSKQIVFDRFAFALRDFVPGPARDALVRLAREQFEAAVLPTLLGVRPRRKRRARR